MAIQDQRKCGAKSKRTGNPCQGLAMANGRCAIHGGKSTGPPKGTQNAKVHGIYAAALTEEEAALSGTILLGNVDEELRIARLRLRRTMLAQRAWDEDGQTEEALELAEVTREIVVDEGKDGKAPVERTTVLKRTRKRPDFEKLIDAGLARIGHLERVRAEIGGGQADYLAAARKIKSALDLIEDTVPAPESDDADTTLDDPEAAS